jgi:ketopantoate reductase
MNPNTTVLPIQNGADPEPVLSGILGREHVMRAVEEVVANIVEPVFVHRFSPLAIIRFGERDESRF